jgi:hypothetical protein
MALAPIALFVYNRPAHARRTVEALQNNELARDSDLIVFSDAAKGNESESSVRKVRDYIGSVQGFKSVRIVERETNFGLARSIIEGVTEVCGAYGRVIVIEDDLVTSRHFLRFMNEALETYMNDDRVASIHGYWYPVDSPVPETFFLRGASCWGWATWSRAWELFERDGARLLAELRRQNLANYFDLDGAIPYTWLLSEQIAGKNDSWAIRWHAATFLANRLQLSPGRSLVQNIGFDGSGIHTPVSKAYTTELAASPIAVKKMVPEECLDARAALIRFYRRNKQGFLVRALRRLSALIPR